MWFTEGRGGINESIESLKWKSIEGASNTAVVLKLQHVSELSGWLGKTQTCVLQPTVSDPVGLEWGFAFLTTFQVITNTAVPGNTI